MLNEDALKKLIMTEEVVLVPCMDRKHQESTRTTFYHLKKKMFKVGIAETIGITKFKHEEKYFVKLYLRKVEELYTLDEDGVPVLMKANPEEDKALQRQIGLMREDGVEEEEIQKVVESWIKEEEEKNEGR